MGLLRCVRSSSPVHRPLVRLALAAVPAIGLAAPLAAQRVADAATESGDIIVTARLTEERLQDIPVSVSVVDPDALRTQGRTSFRDIASVTPGFNFETLQPLVPQASIRGQVNLRTDSPVGNVSFFLDGVYLQRAYLVDQRLIELDRIEVIRGPQSALYGRNAFAGAVSMSSRRPDLENIAGRVTGTFGSQANYEGRGWVSVPLLRDRIALMVAGAYATFDGTWENAHPLANAPGVATRGRIGGYENWMFQTRLLAKLTGTVTVDALYIRTERNEETVPSYTVSTGTLLSNFNNSLNASPRPDLTPPFAVQNRLWVGAFPTEPVISPTDPTRPRGVVIDPRAFGVRGPTEVITGKLTWAPDGPVEASYQLAYLTGKVFGQGSPSPNPTLPINFPPLLVNATIFDASGTDSFYRGWNHEFRFSFRGNERWNGFMGFSYSDTRDIASNASFAATANSTVQPDPSTFLFPIGPGLPFPSALLQRNTYLQRDEDIWSLYGFLEYRLTEKLLLTFEGRYTIEDQQATDFLTREPTNPAVQAFSPPRFNQTLDYFTPRFTATYRLTPDNLVYASVARGVKAGNLNGNTPFLGQRAYGSETNWTYEVGTKNRWGNVTANLAGYHVDWSNLQTTVVRLQANGTAPSFFAIVPSTVGNIGGVRIWGVEGEVDWAVTPELRLFAGGNFSSSRYTDDSVSQRFGASGNCDGIVCQTVPGTPTAVLPVGGNQLERVPRYDGIVGASYDRTLGNGWGLRAMFDATFKGKQYMDEANLSFVEARTLLNGSLGLTVGPADFTFWVRNLLDKDYVSTSLFLIGTSGARSASYVPTFGEQRTFGLTASFGF